MAAEAIAGARSAPRFGFNIIVLLMVALFIQYIDRGNIATAAPLMKAELHLDGTQIGILISAFYWSYTPAQLLSGWLSHRINAYRTLALGLMLWSLATLGTGLATSFAMLIALRLVLGLGESAFWPCNSRLLAQHLPPARLGLANGMIGAGLALGPAVGTFAGGKLMAAAGWRSSFLLFGALSLLWLVPWLMATRGLDRADRAEKATAGDHAPSYLKILSRRDAWGASIGHFCCNYAFYFVISWLPLYLVKERGLSMSEMASVGGAIYLINAAGNLAGGWLADQWMRRGASANLARKTFMVASQAIVGVSLLAAASSNAEVAIFALMAAAVGFGLGTPPLFAIGQTLAGPRAAGKWIGMQNGIGNIAGIVGPVITGAIIDATGGFAWTFVVSGAVALVGILCFAFVIRKVEPLAW